MAKKRKVKGMPVVSQPFISWRIPGKMVLSYDEEANALYIKLKNIEKGQLVTTEEAAPGVLVDLKEDGSAVGIEILLSI